MTSDDITDLIEVINVFSYFFQATEKLSGSDYVTLSLVHPIFFTLLLNMTISINDKPLTKFLKTCLLHFTEFFMEKYIFPREEWYCAATFLDVRVKTFTNLNPTARQEKRHLAIMLIKTLVGNSPMTGVQNLIAQNNKQTIADPMSTQISSSTQGFTYTPPEFSFLDFAQPTTQAKPQGKKASQSKIAQSNNKSKLDIEIDSYTNESCNNVDPTDYFYCFEYIFSMMA